MGTQTLGNTSIGDTVNFFELTNSGGNMFLGITNSQTVPAGGIYVDQINVYGRRVNSGTSVFHHAMYKPHSGGGWDLLGVADVTHSFGTTFTFTHSEFSTPHFVAGGTTMMCAFAITDGGGLEMARLDDGGNFETYTSFGTYPGFLSPGTNKVWGSLDWYVTYFPPVSISGLSASHLTQGSTVTLTGVSFSAGVNSITFDGGSGVNASSWTVVSDTSLQVVIPAGAVSGTITVNTNAGSDTSGTLLIDPTVSSISPSHGLPTSSVTITGTGFNSSTSVTFHTSVSATYTVNSDTQITATVPHGATTGGITVHGGGSSATSSTFTVDSSITSFSPAAGGVGTTITLTGTGFTGSSAGKVNGTACTSYTVVSDTSVTMVVAVGSTTGFLTIVNSGGSTVTSATQFIVAAAYVFRSSVWTSGSVEVERSGVETQAQGVSVFRSGAWVSAQ